MDGRHGELSNVRVMATHAYFNTTTTVWQPSSRNWEENIMEGTREGREGKGNNYCNIIINKCGTILIIRESDRSGFGRGAQPATFCPFLPALFFTFPPFPTSPRPPPFFPRLFHHYFAVHISAHVPDSKFKCNISFKWKGKVSGGIKVRIAELVEDLHGPSVNKLWSSLLGR